MKEKSQETDLQNNVKRQIRKNRKVTSLDIKLYLRSAENVQLSHAINSKWKIKNKSIRCHPLPRPAVISRWLLPVAVRKG